jgi:predicted ATPase
VVTIVGPAGVAKMTVATAAAYCLLEAFSGATVVLDLRMLNDPEVAASSLASILGISANTDEASVIAV